MLHLLVLCMYHCMNKRTFLLHFWAPLGAAVLELYQWGARNGLACDIWCICHTCWPFLMMSLMQAAGKKMAALVGFSQLFKCWFERTGWEIERRFAVFFFIPVLLTGPMIYLWFPFKQVILMWASLYNTLIWAAWFGRGYRTFIPALF